MQTHLPGLLQQTEISPAPGLESDKVEFTKHAENLQQDNRKPASVNRSTGGVLHKCVHLLEY